MFVLDTPIVEKVRYGHVSLDFPSVRTGPDRLPTNSFRGSPQPIRCATYWYRDHLWCADADCSSCAKNRAGGEGVCLVRFVDGSDGLCSLNFELGKPRVSWDPKRFKIIDPVVLEWLFRSDDEDHREQAERWAVSFDAARGLRRALLHAESRGILSGEAHLRLVDRI